MTKSLELKCYHLCPMLHIGTDTQVEPNLQWIYTGFVFVFVYLSLEIHHFNDKISNNVIPAVFPNRSFEMQNRLFDIQLHVKLK
jgi:hypothetical protein